MKRLLFLIGLFLSLSISSAQVTLEKLRANPEDATSLFHPYVAAPDTDTPAPAGYKPFYISHYGRHGSRYETGKSLIEEAPKQLGKLRADGLLTEKGVELAEFLKSVVDESDGRWGELTDLGEKEHREIASRMYKRFTPVFSDKSRQDIHCMASTVTRTIVSMASSVSELRSLAPSLRPDFEVGERYQDIMRLGKGFPDSFAKTTSAYRKKRIREIDFSKCGAILFTDPAAAVSRIPNKELFFESLYRGWAIHYAMGLPSFDLRNYIDEDTFMKVWGGIDGRYYTNFSYPAASELLNDIISRADLAVEGGSICADLRYGHDIMLLRLYNLMGFGKGPVKVEEANSLGDCATAVPMASNLQIVFYRNRKGDVLVKFLYNEREIELPALKAADGPYYSWNDVRKYWTKQ